MLPEIQRVNRSDLMGIERCNLPGVPQGLYYSLREWWIEGS